MGPSGLSFLLWIEERAYNRIQPCSRLSCRMRLLSPTFPPVIPVGVRVT